jgi:serine protease Do
MKVNFTDSLGIACAGLAIGASFLQASEPVKDLKDLANLEAKVEAVSRKVMPATVALISKETESSGSGVITTADGLILTAAHVIQGSEEILVVFPDGKQVPAKVLGANYSKDIAMAQITEKGPWPFVEMGTSGQLAAGDWVIAMGHSAGFDAGRTPPVRFGHVVSEGPGNFLTTDCTLIGGDSGGPLFDLAGKIVGINSSIGVSHTNNNHAGIDGFKADWENLEAGKSWGALSLNPFANPEKPVLGITMGLEPRGVQGVLVLEVTPRSPSAAAGVRVGDIIQAMDGSVILDGQKLQVLLAKRQPGDSVKLGILRDRRTIEREVVLARREDLFSK